MMNYLAAFFGLMGLNLIPALTAGFFRYERALVSIESVVVFIILAVGKKWMGRGILLVYIAIEMVYGFSREYPLFNLRNILELLPMIRFANQKYIFFGIAFFGLYFSLGLVIAAIVKRCVHPVNLLAVLAFVGIFSNISQFTNFDRLDSGKVRLFQQSIFGSQIYELYGRWRADGSEWGTMYNDDNFYPLKSISATRKAWPNGIDSSKVLVIVVESWGLPTSDAEYKQQVLSLVSRNNIEVLKSGAVEFSGGTVAAELRELCNIVPISYAFASVPEKFSGGCLPELMRRAGYATIGLHSAHSGMYARGDWYPTVGFEEAYFLNHPLADVDRCNGFPGFCDVDLIPAVLNRIREGNKVFFYWMTLNSHTPYDAGDLKNQDMSACLALHLSGGARCNQFRLVKEYFDRLGGALARDPIHGLELLIVGDHAPPFIGFSSDTKSHLGVLKSKSGPYDSEFDLRHVPYLYLRVK